MAVVFDEVVGHVEPEPVRPEERPAAAAEQTPSHCSEMLRHGLAALAQRAARLQAD